MVDDLTQAALQGARPAVGLRMSAGHRKGARQLPPGWLTLLHLLPKCQQAAEEVAWAATVIAQAPAAAPVVHIGDEHLR